MMAELKISEPTSAREKLAPPISELNPLHIRTSVTAPRTPGGNHPAIAFYDDHFIRPNRTPTTFLALELKTPKLNAIHQHLWLAGLPNAARPLHRQKLLGRKISITEDPDEHLVWFEDCIYIKPLSDYLFDYVYWNAHLCSDEDLHRSACGMLLSYAWLIRYNSDLDLAKECGLVSKYVEWSDWIGFLDTFFDNIDANTLHQVNKRYQYGELRLSRLNSIYRFLPPKFSIKHIVRGYRTASTWQRAFFERNFKWMLVMFAVLSVSLSALQVALAIPTLQNMWAVQRAAYGFVIASLVAIVIGIVLVFFAWFVLFWYHILSTWHYGTKMARNRQRDKSSA